MALLEILEAPDPRLSTVCDPVERIDAGLLRLLDDMLDDGRRFQVAPRWSVSSGRRLQCRSGAGPYLLRGEPLGEPVLR